MPGSSSEGSDAARALQRGRNTASRTLLLQRREFHGAKQRTRLECNPRHWNRDPLAAAEATNRCWPSPGRSLGRLGAEILVHDQCWHVVPDCSLSASVSQDSSDGQHLGGLFARFRGSRWRCPPHSPSVDDARKSLEREGRSDSCSARIAAAAMARVPADTFARARAVSNWPRRNRPPESPSGRGARGV